MAASVAQQNKIIMDLESKHFNPKEISSLFTLKLIINNLDKEIIPGQMNYELKKFKCDLREKIRAVIKFYVEKIRTGKLTIQDYGQNLQKTMKYFANLKQEQENSGQKVNKYDKLIPTRLSTIKQEIELLVKERDTGLKKIMLISGKNMDKSIFEIIDLDKKPFEEKFLLFATRYKQYHNMITYIAQNMKESRKSELADTYMPLLKRANDILGQLQQGQEASINDIISIDMPPITREIVLGISEDQFNEKLKALFTMVQQCIEQEKKFKDFARNAKKTKDHNWPIYSNMKIKQYQNFFNMLNNINTSWRPLPQIEIREEKRNLIIEDKDIEFLDMVVSFKKLTGVPKGKYNLSFSFELNKAIISETTDMCNDNLEWNYTKKFQRGPDAKNLDNQLHTRTINVNIFKKGMLFGQDEYGRVSIPLADLATKSSIKKSIQVQHKKDTFELHYEIKLRLCTQLFTPINIRSLMVIKQYEPLNINNDLDLFLENKIPEKYRIQQASQIKPQQQQVNKNDEDIVPQLQFLKREDTSDSYPIFSKLLDHQIPKGLTKDELLYPEEFKRTFCADYVQQMDGIIKESSNYYLKLGKFQDRKFAQQQIEEVMGRKIYMESIGERIEQGIVSLNQIYTYYCDAIVRDRIRIEFYIQNRLFEWASFCLARRKLLVKDMLENEWDIEDVKEIDAKALIAKLNQNQVQEEKIKQVLASIKPQVVFLRRGGEFRETVILKQLTEDMLPQGLTMKQALNPEDLDYNYCESYLQIMADQQAKAQPFFAKQGMKEEKTKAKTLQENAMKLIYSLQGKMENGDIDAEEVMNFYNEGIVLDRLRIQLYMKIKLYEWVGFCLQKRTMYIQDMKDNEFEIKDVQQINLQQYI